MRLRLVTALAAGILAGAVVVNFPAFAADQAVQTVAPSSWSDTSVSIDVGDKVTWTNPSGGNHNVHFSDRANEETPVSTTNWTVERTFTQAGTYTFYCDFHSDGTSGMIGTVTVGGSGTGTTNTDTITDTTTTQTGTGTGTGTGTQTSPANTQTGTQTETTTTGADTTAPAFTGKLKRRSSRKALIVELGSSEAGKLEATVSRRAPRRRSFARVGQALLNVKAGRNVVKLPRKAAGSLRSGAYKVKLVLVDAAGNRSGARTLAFKLA